jgi:hypothetical protein
MMPLLTPCFASQARSYYLNESDKTAFVNAVMKNNHVPTALYLDCVGSIPVPTVVTNKKTTLATENTLLMLDGYSSSAGKKAEKQGDVALVIVDALTIYEDPAGKKLDTYKTLHQGNPRWYQHFTEFPAGFTEEDIVSWLNTFMPKFNIF